MKFLLDTNICIYLIREKPEQVLKQVTSRSPEDLALSSITVAELEYGVAKSAHSAKNAAALENFLRAFHVLDFDSAAAGVYGKVRASLERSGHPIGPLDTLIGAHALSLGLALVTNNPREFTRIEGLKIQNWAK